MKYLKSNFFKKRPLKYSLRMFLILSILVSLIIWFFTIIYFQNLEENKKKYKAIVGDQRSLFLVSKILFKTKGLSESLKLLNRIQEFKIKTRFYKKAKQFSKIIAEHERTKKSIIRKYTLSKKNKNWKKAKQLLLSLDKHLPKERKLERENFLNKEFKSIKSRLSPTDKKQQEQKKIQKNGI